MSQPSQDVVSALEDALEGMREMLPYVDTYFVEKWDLNGYVVRAEAALGKARHPSSRLVP